MADSLENIVVSYKLDISEAKQQLQDFNASLTTTAQTGNDVRDSIKNIGIEAKQAFSSSAMDSATRGMQEYARAVHDAKDEISSTAASLKALQSAGDALKSISTSMDAAAKSSKDFKAQSEGLNGSLKAIKESLELINNAVELGKSLKNGLAAAEKTWGLAAAEAMAMATAGISLVIGLVASLISNMNSATKATDEYIEEARRLEEQQQRENEISMENNEQLNEYYDNRIKAKQREIDLLRAENADKLKINATEKELLEIKAAQARVIIANTKEAADGRKENEIHLRGLKESLAFLEQNEEQNKSKIATTKAMITSDEQQLRFAKENREVTQQLLDIENSLLINAERRKQIENEIKKSRDQESTKLKPDNTQLNSQEIEPLTATLPSETISGGEMQKIPTTNGNKKDDDKEEKQAAFKKKFAEVGQQSLNMIHALSGIADAVFKRATQNLEQQFQTATNALDKWHTHASASAEGNAKKQAAVARLYAAQQLKLKHEHAVKEAQIQRKQAEYNKAEKIIEIAIETALSVVKASPAIPLMILAAATGAVSLAVAAAQPLPPIPKFATGVIGFKGRGTQTSDSNIVAISSGESIIKASSTKRYEAELDAIQNMQFESLVMDKYIIPFLKATGKATGTGNDYDDWLLRKDVREGNRAIKKSAEYIVQGVTEAVKTNGYFNSRYHA